MRELWYLLEFCDLLWPLCVDLHPFDALLNSELSKGQVEAFVGLSDDDMSGVGTLKVRLLGQRVLDPRPLQRNHTVHQDPCDKDTEFDSQQKETRQY